MKFRPTTTTTTTRTSVSGMRVVYIVAVRGMTFDWRFFFCRALMGSRLVREPRRTHKAQETRMRPVGKAVDSESPAQRRHRAVDPISLSRNELCIVRWLLYWCVCLRPKCIVYYSCSVSSLGRRGGFRASLGKRADS